jgi:hypothetical protein
VGLVLMVYQDFAAGEAVRVRLKSILGLVVLLLYGLVGVAVMLALTGQSLRFDGRERRVDMRLWFGLFRRSWPARRFTAVRLVVLPPDEDGEESCAVRLLNRRQRVELDLEGAAADDPAALNVVRAAVHLRRLFRLPLSAEGEPRKATRALRQALARLAGPRAAAADWEAPLLPGRRGKRSPQWGDMAWLGVGVGVLVVALVLFLLLPWQTFVIWSVAWGMGALLVANGVSGIREERVTGVDRYNTEFRGTAAVLVGHGQCLAGGLMILVVPLVLLVRMALGAGP